MQLVYRGKTKDVFDNGDGTYILRFKDDMTGENGVFDPGANTVGLSVEGMGRSGLRLSQFFFEKLNSLDIPTHYISADIDKAEMKVYPSTSFGDGLEVIIRYRAVGSFLRRYGKYCREGDKLDGYVEFTLKDDERGDPLITQDGLAQLNLLSFSDYEYIKKLSLRIAAYIRDLIAKADLELYDLKLEFGRIGEDQHIALVDELSGGNMRVYKDKQYIEPFKLENYLLSTTGGGQ